LKVQCLTLWEAGVPLDFVCNKYNVLKSAVYRWRRLAYARGYNSEIDPRLMDFHVDKAPKSGRPTLQTAERTLKLLEIITSSKEGRNTNCRSLGGKLGVSMKTAARMLKKNKFKSCKETTKPGLTPEMKAARLAFCKAHADWTLEQWKNVIWSDETSVVLGHRRGKYRIWRRPWEKFNKTCVRSRWKNGSEFMFWACFSWDKKGPFHIWKKEKAAQKKAAQAEIDAYNSVHEMEARCEWELSTAMRRLRLGRNPGGKKPVWKFTAARGAMTRTGKAGGIDAIRYRREVLIPKLIPFAQACMVERPDTLVQEDNAPAHASHFQQSLVYDLYKVMRLLWPGNSPDLNMIEPAWMWVKMDTTKLGAPSIRKEAEKSWERTWKKMSQERIQGYIKRIMRHIQMVIMLEGDNKYREGDYKKGEVHGETGEWVDLGEFDTNIE
jgi:hypothetical protein